MMARMTLAPQVAATTPTDAAIVARSLEDPDAVYLRRGVVDRVGQRPH
jgi:hypothetical protein